MQRKESLKMQNSVTMYGNEKDNKKKNSGGYDTRTWEKEYDWYKDINKTQPGQGTCFGPI